MSRISQFKCTKNVNMQDGTLAFVSDKIYTMYNTSLKNGYDRENVIRTTNEEGKKHVVKSLDGSRLDEFFNEHFAQV